MNQSCERVQFLDHKLRMIDISQEVPAYTHGDYQPVLASTTIPESTLKNKSSFLAYHLRREGVAMNNWRTVHVNAHDDEVDLLTKVIPFGEKMRRVVRKVLIHIYVTSMSHHRSVVALGMATGARKRHYEHHLSFWFIFISSYF